MSQGRLYFILLLRPYRDLSIRTMYLFADIIQGKFLRENRDYLGFICEMVEYSHWKLRYIVIKHSVMQTLLPIWRFLFVVLHKLTFSQESRSAHLWILIHLKPESVISWQFYDVSFFVFFYQYHIFSKKNFVHEYEVCFPRVHIQCTHIPHERVHQMATNNILHTLNHDFFLMIY